ncbi:MIP/aquaporin family protein [Flavihumibacter fluvii]|uniref:MIP/aquaporin family protein n=1 Tax=Flavihumibacter fluvii TaxID=2838157 RepID=UPI001BDEFEA6|nr:aquaporin [Flavihumibacter fluvii]ULQ54118.1 aquaporin [Flavihumibacter fluvii]
MKQEKFPWRLFWAEFLGVALLLLIGLSLVIFMFGVGSPMETLIPSVTVRRVITGFLFGGTGSLISLTRLGRESGAHINPAVTMVFWLFRKVNARTVRIYITAQMMGAVVGCLPLLLWGQLGRSISFGVTTPGPGYALSTVVLGEVITTFTLVSLLAIFIGFRHLRPYTPFISPILYSIMVPLEAGISGTSTNPARSFGPAVISGVWQDWWIYLVGPLAGALLSALVFSFLAKKITVAKLYHFDSDRDGLFRRMSSTDQKVEPIASGNPEV